MVEVCCDCCLAYFDELPGCTGGESNRLRDVTITKQSAPIIETVNNSR